MRRRMNSIGIMVLLCLIGGSLLSGQSLVSNVNGKIHVIILHYGDGGWGGFWHEPSVFMIDLMEKMDPDVGFVVLLGQDKKAERARKILEPYAEVKLPDGTPRVKFLQVKVKTRNFYPWARDGYLILVDKNNNLTFMDVGFGEDPFPITNWVEVFHNAKTLAGMIHRGGGNIRTTQDQMVIGMDTMLGISVPGRYSSSSGSPNIYSAAKGLKKEDLPLFKTRFKAYCDFIHRVLAPDKEMIIPGEKEFFAKLEKGEFDFKKTRVHHTGAQAAYHTDVYLGLGHKDESGKRIAFVADATLGAKVLENMSPEERRKVERTMPYMLVEEGFTAAEIPVTAEQIAGRFKWEEQKLLDACLKATEKASKTLDKAALRMEELGFHVVRIPYLPNGLVDPDRSSRQFGLSFNYSNILVEVYENIKRIYIPEYGFTQMDNAAEKAYRESGYEVIKIKGYVTHGLTPRQDGAGLDCLTSEIRFPVQWADQKPEKK